jgi:hypothetical protein
MRTVSKYRAHMNPPPEPHPVGDPVSLSSQIIGLDDLCGMPVGQGRAAADIANRTAGSAAASQGNTRPFEDIFSGMLAFEASF